MIWQPDERDVSLTADLYQIEIEDVVDSLGFLTAYQQCFNVNGVSNPTYSVENEFCQAIHRDPITSNAGYVEGGNFNLSKRFTQGLDVSLNWRKDMAGGVFGINSSINKLFSWQQPASADPDSPMLEYAGTAGGGNSYYDYRLFTQFSYSRNNLSRRVELALFAGGDARLEGADPDADGRGYRGVPSVQRERLVAVQRAHSVARRYRQHRR